MAKTANDFYLLFCNNEFKKVTETINDGFSGMYFVLKILSDTSKEFSAGDISETFQVSTARTAVILKTLEGKGYIIKSKSKNDARKTIVKITDKGTEILNERISVLLSKINGYLSKLNDYECENFYEILKKLLS